MKGKTRCVIAAGSNLGDRRSHLEAGVAGLSDVLARITVSDVVESPAEGGADQGDYLNLVLFGWSDFSARTMLTRMLEIERIRGRERRAGSGEPRTLDLDLIFHGDAVVREPGLVVPHPRWHRRAFVVHPLLQILPGGKDPETGRPLRECVSDEILMSTLRTVGPIRTTTVSPR